MSQFFLPRIRDILQERRGNIENNYSDKIKLQEHILELEEVNKNLLDTATSSYKLAIKQAIKEASLNREIEVQNFKLHTIKMIDQSRTEISKFRQDCYNNCQKIVEQTNKELGNKFFKM